MPLRALRLIARALAEPLPPEQTAAVVCSQIAERFQASACVVYLTDGSADAKLVGAVGVADQILDNRRTIPLSADLPLAASIRTGEAIWCENREALVRAFPSLASSSFPREHLQAAVAVPFCIDGQIIGGMALSFSVALELSDIDREALVTIGDLCAHSIIRYRLEQRFRKMHDASPDGVLILRPCRDEQGGVRDFKVVYVNPALAEAMGRAPESLTAHTLLESLPKLRETFAWDAFCRVAETGELEVFEHSSADYGWDGWYRNVVVSLGDEIAITYTDLTSQKKNQESASFLAAAETVLSSSLDYDVTLSTVVKLAVPGVADLATVDMLDSNGKLTRLAAAHSASEKEVQVHEETGRFPIDLKAAATVANVLRTGRSQMVAELSKDRLAASLQHPELIESVRQVGLSSAICLPMKARGRVVGVISLFHGGSRRRYDHHDLEVLEEVARRAGGAIENALLYRAVQEANQAKDEFLAVVSHELRTPLNAILGWVHILRERAATPEQRERALAIIERNARSQKDLIEDLLDVSRIVSGKLTLDVTAVDLTQVIERAVDTVRPTATSRGVIIQPTLDPHAGPVNGDEERLQQVVWNLLSNAVKFSEDGGKIQVVLKRTASVAELSVVDHGKGIEPSFLPYVFERFRQAETHNTRTKGGLGLGLAIVRNLVEMHGGTVRAESDGLGFGATFIVRFPITPLRSGSLARLPAVHLTAPEVGYCPPELDGLRVLVVDDDGDARELLAALLGSCKINVTTASSAREALLLVESSKPDILISDIGMPDEDGCELMRKIRRLPPTEGGRTPAIALTAYARAEERTKALVAGFNMHLPKPVEPADLLASLASLARVVQRRDDSDA